MPFTAELAVERVLKLIAQTQEHGRTLRQRESCALLAAQLIVGYDLVIAVRS